MKHPRIDLPYGRVPYPLDLGGRAATVVRARNLPPPRDLAQLLTEALASPIEAAPLAARAAGCGHITIIVSDATRSEPRGAFLDAIVPALPPDAQLTVAVATGTHGPTRLDALGLPAAVLQRARIVNHDGHSDRDLVALGSTPAGTPVRVHRCLVDADLVIATGCIRPHYFAGFGAGCKAIFPGLGAATDIRINHRLKTAPGARAGVVDGNPCRADLAAAARLLATPVFLVNGVCGPDGLVHAVVAGDLDRAFAAGVAQARAWFTATAPAADVAIASDALPVTASLYQAAKIAAAVAPIVKPGGRLVLVAECADGVEPLDVVNEAIFRIGVLPRLATGATIELVSALSAVVVARTLVRPVAAIEVPATGSVVVIPKASSLLLEVES